MSVGFVVLAVYALGYLACWRTVSWYIAADLANGGRVGGEDLVFGATMGTLLTFFWPAILAGIAVNRVYRLRGESINALVIPRSQKRRFALDERERRIAQLEREVGIR